MTGVLASVAPVGEAPDDRTRIERAMVSRLEALHDVHGGYLRELGPYNGEISDAAGLEQIIARLQGRTPAVLVMVGTVQYREKSRRKLVYKAEYRVEVLCISNHWRSRETRNQGDLSSRLQPQADPGIYRILYDVRQRLMGERLGVCGAGRIVPVLEQVVLQADNLTAWNAVFEVPAHVTQESPSERAPHPAESVVHRHNLEESDAENPVAEGETDG